MNSPRSKRHETVPREQTSASSPIVLSKPDYMCNKVASDLPSCSWKEFADAMGIGCPASGMKFLDCLSQHFRKSGQAKLAPPVIDMATQIGKDPYVYWMWLLIPEFRPEPDGTRWQGDLSDPEEYFLISMMRKECTGTEKDWEKLAQDCVSEWESKAQSHYEQHLELTGMHLYPVPRKWFP